VSRAALIVLAIIAASSTAHAQSKRYPKPPVDEDKRRDAHSELWDAANHPGKAPYNQAIALARAKLDQRTDDERNEAIRILSEAIRAEPDEPVAYQLLGTALLQQRDWVHCADNLALAVQHAHRDEVVKPDTRRDLGVCQARANRLADAERTLADAASLGSQNGELWMRLGETRIAMGKLDEARAALDTALTLTTDASQTQILWLRALADDRARQPSAAEDDVRRALGFDRLRAMIDNPVLPLLGDGERDYAMGLSFADADPREPEQAIVFFRHFLEVAPRSPWRRRAEEHLRDLSAIELPMAVKKLSGMASLDGEAAVKAVRATLPKLRACLA
jgi:tetratricopeptide (TPR) repeat protein